MDIRVVDPQRHGGPNSISINRLNSAQQYLTPFNTGCGRPRRVRECSTSAVGLCADEGYICGCNSV